MKNRNNLLTTILLVLGCLALSPLAQAVVPAPDGGYPGGNTAEGQNALLSLTTGGFNTAIGYFSLRSNTVNSFNTAVGAGALFANSAPDPNLGFGQENTATGAGALFSNSDGFQNTANGAFALFSNRGNLNTAIGTEALKNNTAGSENVALGADAGVFVITANNVICIGAEVLGADVSNSCFIGSIRGVTTAIDDAIPVLIDAAGQLGTTSSSRRYKTDIKPMEKASESILALKPVSFRYKVHKDTTPQFGLIAEEVAQVNPDLVVRDNNGEIYTVRYDAVNAMLLNEFLKEHRKVQEQETTIAQLKQEFQSKLADQQKQIKAVASGLQEVSNQLAAASPSRGGLEMSKAAPSVVLNNP